MGLHRHRRSTRLIGRDYALPGVYFVTMCCRDRACLLGDVSGERVLETPLGTIVRDEWFRSQELRRYLELRRDEFVVMPDHVHGIVRVVVGALVPDRDLEAFGAPQAESLAGFVRAFKVVTTRRSEEQRTAAQRMSLWQRGYYERIVRTDDELRRVREYIARNPERWRGRS
jgi:putative transposase